MHYFSIFLKVINIVNKRRKITLMKCLFLN